MEHWRSYLRGRMLEMFGYKPQAIEAYAEAARANPRFAAPCNRIAFLLSSQGRFKEAEPHFETVLRLEPGNAIAHFNFGYTLDKRGLHARAVEAFREATRLRPGLDRAWYGLGLAHAGLGQHREAAQALERAAQLQPMNPHAWYALGMAHHATGDLEKFHGVVHHLHRFDRKMTRRLIQDSGASDLDYLVKDLLV